MSSDPSTSLHGCSVALLSCGQFDPPTYAHLRMFERARDFLMRTMGCKVVEGIMNVSPDKLSTRALAKHRLRMVETAVRKNFWIRAGGFECNQKTSMKLVTVIKHYQEKLSHKYDEPIQVMYVCGSEELDNFVSTKTDNSSTWSPSEVKELLQNHGLVVLRRARTHPSQTIYLTDILRQYQKNIYVIEDETFPNDLRCSRIRIALRRGESVRYCLDDDVIEYITEHNLYETSSDHNYADCLPTTSTRRYCDAYKVPPESPRQSFFDGLNGKYKDNMVSSLKWGTSCSSLPSECSSREESGSSHLPPKNLHSNANLIVSDRHTAKSLKTEAETLPYPSELQLNRQLCDSIPSTTLSETISNHISVTATGKNDVAVANRLVPEHPLTPCTVDNTQINDFADENHHNVVPGVMQTSVTSAPISSQPNFVADIALEKKQTGCEVIPSCVDISPAPTNGDGKQRGSTNSPAYDNATLDDIVAASNSWAMYMQKENKRVQGLKNEDCKESLVPSGWLSKSVTPKREKDKKRCWFFNRSDNNLEDVDLSNEERSPVRMCSTYQQRQNHTSPELLWQKNNQSMHDERWCEIPTSSRSLLHNLPQSDQYTLGLSNDTISKSMTTSDIVHSTRTRFATPLSNTKMITQSRREHKAKHGDGVTLRFRRYNLTSTTETTV